MKSSKVLTLKEFYTSVVAVPFESALPIVLVVMLGVFMLIGAGFVQTTHDIAHDTRHSLGFPCH